jgi:hypothetical protein
LGRWVRIAGEEVFKQYYTIQVNNWILHRQPEAAEPKSLREFCASKEHCVASTKPVPPQTLLKATQAWDRQCRTDLCKPAVNPTAGVCVGTAPGTCSKVPAQLRLQQSQPQAESQVESQTEYRVTVAGPIAVAGSVEVAVEAAQGQPQARDPD